MIMKSSKISIKNIQNLASTAIQQENQMIFIFYHNIV
jgi:hypothetical protein